MVKTEVKIHECVIATKSRVSAGFVTTIHLDAYGKKVKLKG